MADKIEGRPDQLTDQFLKNVAEPGTYSDGPGRYGLNCFIDWLASGDLQKYFRHKLTFDGNRIDVGIGAYPEISLQNARDIAHENWKKARAGIDPRKKELPKVKLYEVEDKSRLLFNEVSEMVITERSKNWKGTNSGKNWRGILRREIFPKIGHLPIGQVTEDHVYGIIVPLSTTKNRTSAGAFSILKLIFEWCEDNNYRADTPVTDKIRRQVIKTRREATHFRHVPYDEVFDAIQVIRKCSVNLAVKLALEFQIFTAVRHKSIRDALWTEIDWKTKIWVIPADHMKMEKEHRVPLNAGALAVLKKAFKLLRIAGSDLIFPSHQKGEVIGDSTLANVCKKIGLSGTPHGFRGSFATWCAEKGVPQQLAEAALAHTPAKIVKAYTHTDYFDRRKRLMDAWSEFIAGNLPDDWTLLEGAAAATHKAHLESQRLLAESQKTIEKLATSNATLATSIEALGSELAALRAEMALLKAA